MTKSKNNHRFHPQSPVFDHLLAFLSRNACSRAIQLLFTPHIRLATPYTHYTTLFTHSQVPHTHIRPIFAFSTPHSHFQPLPRVFTCLRPLSTISEPHFLFSRPHNRFWVLTPTSNPRRTISSVFTCFHLLSPISTSQSFVFISFHLFSNPSTLLELILHLFEHFFTFFIVFNPFSLFFRTL